MLEKYQGLPKNNIKDYQKIYNFLWFNKEREDVRKLIFLYPNSISYSLINNRDFKSFHTRSGVRLFHAFYAYLYITFVYKEYGVFPCETSEPMEKLKKSVIKRGFDETKNYDPWFNDFVKDMIALGCDENKLKEICER